jgi:hypothetical protein
MNILIYIVSYNTSYKLKKLLYKIPFNYLKKFKYTIYISDDCSRDDTSYQIIKSIKKLKKRIIYTSNTKRLFYGGNQKKCLNFGIKNNFEIAVMLHGDGQYNPNKIPLLLEPFCKEKDVSAMFGSRMINKKNALRGGMPYYKFFGNILLTKFQNFILKKNLSEYHTGFRAYRLSFLKKIKYKKLSDGFNFDNQIILQLFNKKMKILEKPIPTFYGNEISHVNGFYYAFIIFIDTLIFILNKIKLIKIKIYN